LLYRDALRDRPTHAFENDPCVADASRDEAQHELEARFGVSGIVERGRRQRDREQRDEDEGDEKRAPHQSFGPKKISNRGPAPGRESGCATSNPTVTTGSLQRNPSPAEYSMK